MRTLALSVTFVLGAVSLGAQDANPAPNLYRDQIKLIFQKSCLACHNPGLKQGGLDLSTREAMLRGSEHGPVVSLGKPDESQLYKVVAHVTEPGMPFKGKKLPDADIARISEWIKAGAEYGEPVSDAEGVSLTEVRKHWAFRNPVRPAVPKTKQAYGNPIDAFLEADRAKRGLSALQQTDKATLLRRVYVDLTGLPPTPEQVMAFSASKDPKAYEKIVDQLLQSPGYGERWGRHWLDIWRYSDWYGYRQSNQVRYSQRHIWRWRDWTIESLNQNKPYNRMIEEMLAGDELAPDDPSVVRATGYLARNWYLFNRNVWLGDIVEYTSAGFLGITLKCARCHAHKYDPIPQADYYRFRAFFEPHEVRTDRVPGEADIVKDGMPRVYDADEARPTYRFIRGNENNPDTSTPLQPAVPLLFGKPDLHIEPISLPVQVYFPDSRPFVPGDLIAQGKANIEKAVSDLKKAKEKPEAEPLIVAATKRVEAAQAALPALEARIQATLASLKTPVPENSEKLAEEARKLELAANMIQAEADIITAKYDFELGKKDEKKLAAATAKLEAAVKGLKEPAEGYTPIGAKYPATSSGRRLALARWIASKDNPLTARVAINDMWMRHFGKPLVPTVFNFGRSGKAPTNPELLDWLAVEFMDRNWDMKAIHRLMVTSDAYKMASSPAAAESPQVKVDQDNVYYWRMNVRRMEAEAIRDSMLAIAGKLDTTIGGPELDETKGHEVFRRSIYFRTAPDLQMDMLQAFDVASPIECFARSESIVPQQALALANGKLSFTVARTIAAQLSPAAASASAFVNAAFLKVLDRPPTAAEARESEKYLAQQTELYRDPAKLTPFKNGTEVLLKPSAVPAQRARESLVHVLLNHNDFVTLR
jgi:mono/diheme cytochrome c family protein